MTKRKQIFWFQRHIGKTITEWLKAPSCREKSGRNYFIFIGLLSAMLFHLAALAIRTVRAFWLLDYTHYCYRWPYVIFFLVLPPAVFLGSTLFDRFNYRNRKKALLALCLAAESLQIASFAFKLLSRLFLPVIFKISPGKAFTKDMVVALGRICVELPVCAALLFMAWKLKTVFFSEKNLKPILSYKVLHRLEPKRGIYDLRIVKDINSGKYVTVTEKDRFLHFLCDGSSGTGKTSSTILPAIRDDLDAHLRMEEKQLEALKEMEQRGEIFYASYGRKPGTGDFLPAVGRKNLEQPDMEAQEAQIREKLNKLALCYPVAGITVLAPDDSLTDDVCRLCEARGISYNRIDPTRLADGRRKENSIGMNPFYLRSEMNGEEKNQLIVKKAVIFADVMQAITELKGKSDSYFSGVNRQMIANLAILVMLTIPALHKRQATPMDLQEVINDFDKLKAPLTKLKELDQGINQFQFVIKYIESDLLGAGRVKMEDQSRGTRNIINEFLLMPYNREVFCSQESIDFDRILENGEVTVCNYNLAAGDTDATAFGLFFLLSFNNAVLSRPGTEHTRIPHFFYVDELPVLIHPSIEKNFSLFRKYRVAMFVAIQTLDQMEKNDITKYLKGVILGCAHILVFGRSSITDMEIFSKFAGVRDEVEEERGITQTALSDVNTRLTYTERESIAQKNTIEEIDIRLKDFQEVTFFTTRNGRPLEAIHGKVEFLKPEDWEKKARKEFVFHGVQGEQPVYPEAAEENMQETQLQKVSYPEELLFKQSGHVLEAGQGESVPDREAVCKKKTAVGKEASEGPVYHENFVAEEIEL